MATLNVIYSGGIIYNLKFDKVLAISTINILGNNVVVLEFKELFFFSWYGKI